jgi:hypothetical protein
LTLALVALPTWAGAALVTFSFRGICREAAANLRSASPAFPELGDLFDDDGKEALNRLIDCRLEREWLWKGNPEGRDDARLLLPHVSELERRAVDLLWTVDHIGRCLSRRRLPAIEKALVQSEEASSTTTDWEEREDLERQCHLLREHSRLCTELHASKRRLTCQLATITHALELIALHHCTAEARQRDDGAPLSHLALEELVLHMFSRPLTPSASP